MALRKFVWRHYRLLSSAEGLFRDNAGLGQWLLRERKQSQFGFQRDLDEHGFLPQRIRYVRMQRGQLGQRDQCDMRRHADERQLQQRRREWLCGGYASRCSRYDGLVEVDLRGQLQRDDSSVFQGQVLPAVRVDIRLRRQWQWHCHGDRFGRHAALHLLVANYRRVHSRLGERSKHLVLVSQPPGCGSPRLHRQRNGLRRIGWPGYCVLGHASAMIH